MNSITEQLTKEAEQLYTKLRTQRDDLKLQAHLMGAEAQEKWQEAEQQWQRVNDKFSVIKKGVEEAGKDIVSGFLILGSKMIQAYRDIEKSIRSSQLTK